MGKKTRTFLYVFSIVVLLAMFILIVFSRKRQNTKEVVETNAEIILETDTGKETEKTDTGWQAEPGKTATDVAESIENRDDDCTTLIFAGDVLFANAFKANYDAGGIEKVIDPQLLEELTDADIFMVNNEFPFSSRGEPMEDKEYTFRCDPKYVNALSEMGVDVVSLANNHALDYGRDALSDTFAVLNQAGILYAGAGDTAERAYELQVIEKNGKKFGFLAASRVVPQSNWKVEERAPGMLTAYDDTKLVQLIENARSECDFLSVFLHWGVEYDAQPQDYQTKIATDCFDAGADVVIGTHTHCLQGASFINGKPVFYSLGNFVFGQSIDRSVAVKVEISSDGTAVYRLLPVYAADGTTKLMDTDSAASLYQYMMNLSDGIAIDADGKIN